MRATAQIMIQKAPRRRRPTSWPLTGLGTTIAIALLISGSVLIGLAFVGH